VNVRWIVAAVAVSSLAACGSDDDSSDVAADSSTSESTLVAPVATSPPTSPSTTAETTTTAATTTAPPTTLPPEVDCLQGSWWLSPEETTALYSALLPGMPVTVTGTHWAEFSGDAVDYWAILEVRFAVGGTDVTFGLDQHGVGTYTVVDDALTMNYDTFESRVHDGHGEAIYDREQEPSTYADGAVDIADNGDGTITINRVTVPVIDIPPVAGGPMGCDDSTMSLGFTSGLADTAAVFVRMSE
jgi:hypothetical protein